MSHELRRLAAEASDLKQCTQCGQVLPVAEFYTKNTPGGLYAECKACNKRRTASAIRTKLERLQAALDAALAEAERLRVLARAVLPPPETIEQYRRILRHRELYAVEASVIPQWQNWVDLAAALAQETGDG